MNAKHQIENERLSAFKAYLITTAEISESTASDYVKRIVTICKEEDIDLEYLIKNIEKISHDYTEGEKIELGRRSHNSYKSALLQLKKFVIQGGVIYSKSNKPKYHIEVNQVPGEGFGVIKLFDETNNLLATDTTLDKRHHNVREMARDMYSKSVKLMFDNIYNKNDTKFLEVLRIMDCSFTISGHELIK